LIQLAESVGTDSLIVCFVPINWTLLVIAGHTWTSVLFDQKVSTLALTLICLFLPFPYTNLLLLAAAQQQTCNARLCRLPSQACDKNLLHCCAAYMVT
jgi:hypothetical protein